MNPSGHHCPGETNGVAYSQSSAAGPFIAVANLTCHGCEDPFVWQQPDGTVHMIYHNRYPLAPSLMQHKPHQLVTKAISQTIFGGNKAVWLCVSSSFAV